MPEMIQTLSVAVSGSGSFGPIGVGIVVHERREGRGLGAMIERIAELHADPLGADTAFAILRALHVAKARGLTRIVVRCTDGHVKRWLRKRMRRRPPDGVESPTLREILELAGTFQHIAFRWVPRRKNQPPRRLARDIVSLARGPRPARARPCDDDDDIGFDFEDEMLGADLEDADELDPIPF
jgi:ribonuclease HI